jgi:hypothetical protein
VTSTALMRIPVGVVVERRKAKSPWLDFLWRPVSVLPGTPSASPWTPIGAESDRDSQLSRQSCFWGACIVGGPAPHRL